MNALNNVKNPIARININEENSDGRKHLISNLVISKLEIISDFKVILQNEINRSQLLSVIPIEFSLKGI
jgi:hypothetical protein